MVLLQGTGMYGEVTWTIWAGVEGFGFGVWTFFGVLVYLTWHFSSSLCISSPTMSQKLFNVWDLGFREAFWFRVLGPKALKSPVSTIHPSPSQVYH